MAITMQQESGREIDFSDPLCIDKLLAYLYQHLVRYTETQVRHAIRLDYWNGGDGDEQSHPLLNKLSGAETDDPAVALDVDNKASGIVNPHHSRAAAYVRLLELLGNDTARLADYLMISLSWCYRCCKRARETVTRQQQLPQTLEDDFMPRRWRRFKLSTAAPHAQMSLNLPLPWEN